MRIPYILFFLCLVTSIFAQQHLLSHDLIPGNIPSYKPAYQDDYPDWAKMLYTEPINYYDLQEAYDQWQAYGQKDYRPIERYYKIWLEATCPFITSEGRIDLTLVDEYERNLLETQASASIQPNVSIRQDPDWSFIGPRETFWLNESGSPETPAACPWQVNVYSFDVAKTDYNTIYCGTETGFVSKTIDNGLSWQLLGRNYHFGGGVTAVVIHPELKNIVYVAAGNQIHKTIDGGSTWQPLLQPGNFFHADKIIIDPLDPDRLLTAGSSGIHLSKDSGETWTRVWDQATYDVHFKPDDNEIVYGISSTNGSFDIAMSYDGGSTFESDPNLNLDITDAAGGLLAVTSSDPDIVIGVFLSENNTPYLYKKSDPLTGAWELLAIGQTNALQLNNGQGFFDLVLEISPLDPNIVFVGTTTLYKSTDGGTNYTLIGGYGGDFPIHPDIQCMLLLDNSTSWVSTDGGFTFSTDNFTNPQNADARNNLLIGSDMWGFDQGWNEDLIVGGRYHNGNTTIADFYQPKALRMGGAESPTGWIMKGKSRHAAFNDLGSGWVLPTSAESMPEGRFIFSKYPNMDEYGGRRGNLFFHPYYYEVVYLGEGNGFWKSSDMGQSFELLHDFGSRIRFCQVAPSDPDIMYADVIAQGFYKSIDGGYTWTQKPSLTSGGGGNPYWRGKTHFVISPADANTIYACLNNGTWSSDIGKVLRSTNGGDTWDDWTGTLNEFTKTLVIQPDSSGADILYLFTSNRSGRPGKCFIRRPGEADWSEYGEKYPAGLSPNYALPFFRDSKIRVAGNGGVWETDLDDTAFQPIVRPWAPRPYMDCMLDTIQLEAHSIIDHSNCTWTWEIVPQPIYIDQVNKRNPLVVLGEPGSYDVTLTITKDGVSFSRKIEGMIETTECPSIDNCNNPGQLPKDFWELLYVDSEEVNYPGYATMAFDGDPGTIWHTRWSTGSDPYPHEIQIDLGEAFNIHEFAYLPRQQGQNGWIKDYELYISDDPQNWGIADTIGQFEASAAPKKVQFDTSRTGRYVRLVALSEVNDNAWASAAEFSLKGCREQSVSVNDPDGVTALKAFPVPTNGVFQVSLPGEGMFSYTLHTLSGQLIKTGEIQAINGAAQVDLTECMDGLYLIRLRDNQGRSFITKVVKTDR